MSPLRLGIIGCGGIAGYAAGVARLISGLRLTACCDSTLEVASHFAHQHHIPRAYDDYHQLIADPDVEALYVAVPHHLHYPVLAAAVAARKPVLCEKPITRTLEEGIDITRQIQRAGLKVGVNYQYRYDSAAYAMASAARGGMLGELRYAHCNIPWRRDASYFPPGGWRASKASAGGGTLLTQGSHMLDLMLWAMGSRAVTAAGMTARRVFQQVEVEDLAQGILALESGAQISITSAMVANPEQPLRVEIYGEKGTAIYTNRPWPRVQFLGVGVTAARPPVAGVHALQRSLKAFRDWLTRDRPYLIPAQEALPALAAVDAIYRAAESGQAADVVDVEAALNA